MAVELTPGALSKRINGTYDMNPVVQVIDIKSNLSSIEVKGDKVENKVIYNVVLSDGLICKECQIFSGLNGLITSNKMQQGSIVKLTNFEINPRDIFILNLEVIYSKSDIIGDPKPFTSKKTPSSAISRLPIIDMNSCSQSQSKKRKVQSSDNMIMEKNKYDDIAACFEKLEKIGWGTEDPLYDIALLLFVEGVEYRKLWLLLKPESCRKWVKNVGSKLGLLG